MDGYAGAEVTPVSRTFHGKVLSFEIKSEHVEVYAVDSYDNEVVVKVPHKLVPIVKPGDSIVVEWRRDETE